MYKYIEPEVSGGLGEKTKLDNTVHPPIVHKLHFEFNDWLGDDIIETFPCYIVTERLKIAITNSNLKGVVFDDVIITTSDSFKELNKDLQLPIFYWMKIEGKGIKDDFTISNDLRLIVSEKAFLVLKKFNLKGADIEDFISN